MLAEKKAWLRMQLFCLKRLFKLYRLLKMSKQKILANIPIYIIAVLLIYTWVIILSTWRHYLSAIAFVVLILLFNQNLKKRLLATISYLVLGTCNLFVLTPSITSNSYGVKLGSLTIWTPNFQILSFVLLVVSIILNFDSLINIYLDYKEKQQRNK